MLASLLGFANTAAKDESGGFFRGFPSYWNIVAFYAGLLAAGGLLDAGTGRWINAALLIALAVFTVVPIWLIYPNLAPRPWKPAILGGAYLWLILLLVMFPWYPRDVHWSLVLISLIYPIFYVVISLTLGHKHRRHKRAELR
jgi:phosphatidylcholine synthase